MSSRRSQRFTYQDVFKSIEDDEVSFTDADIIDIAFIPDPFANDEIESEDDEGN